MNHPPPSAEILAQFGVPNAIPVPLAGGMGVTFRADQIALKRCEDPVLYRFLAPILESLPEKNFRLARPVRSGDGDLIVDGWCASHWLEGQTDMRNHWLEAIAALDAFHDALLRVVDVHILHQTNTPFTQADRDVWADPPRLSLGIGGDRLIAFLRPIDLPAQLVQGDPSEGNFLFAPNLPPAIIDVAPYWHPADYATALLVADGIAWSKAPVTLLQDIAVRPQIAQLLLRAILFRLQVSWLFRGAPADTVAYEPVIQFIKSHA